MRRPSSARLFTPLLHSAERRLPSLTRLRAAETLPIRLHRRRIFIVPTGFGIVFAFILMVMLLGALNYSNNAALLLTCVLGATWIGSMLHTFRNLDRLELRSLHAAPVVAGDDAALALCWRAHGHVREAIELRIEGKDASFRIAPHTAVDVRMDLATTRRGWMAVPRIKVFSRWPFGWFRAWSWLAPAQSILVYPRPEAAGPPPPAQAATDQRARRRHGDEWAGLRDYHSGDPLRLVAWKASARGAGLRVKTFDQPSAEHTWQLAWDSVRLADPEARIARLARWVREAAASGRSWSLQLPGKHLPVGQGPGHFRRSMQALAELP